MANKKNAVEWLKKAYHDLGSAQLLYAAGHYTDTIANDLQQAIEKMLKSFLAYENKKIRRTHDLIEVSELIDAFIHFDAHEIDLLDIATTYHTKERYPGPVDLPPREQVAEVLDFALNLFTRVCQTLEISKTDVEK